MRAFAHKNAASAEEAIAESRASDGSTCWIAGGTDLLGVLKDQILPDYPTQVVNLKTIPGLDAFELDGQGLRIGAMTRLSILSRDEYVRGQFPLLAAAAESVATPEIRNMATLGGNLCQDNRCWYYRYPHHMGGRMPCKRKGSGPCHAVRGDNRYHVVTGGKGCFAPCPSDTAVALAALDAILDITGPEGRRTVPVGEFYTPMGHVLEPREIVTSVFIPTPPSGSRQQFRKFTVRKPVDFAVVSVAAVVGLDDDVCREARIVLGGVAPAPLRAKAAEQFLVGKELTTAVVAEAAESVLADARPLSKNAYKIGIARNLVRGMLESFLPETGAA